MSKTKKKHNGNNGTLVLDGEATVNNISMIRDSILGILDGSDVLNLDISRLKKIDLTLFQLMCSVCTTAEKMNKKIDCSDWPSHMANSASNPYGTCNKKQCREKGGPSCIWNRLN